MVAGAVGAHLGSDVILILGFANLLADGFAMSVGAFLSAKTEKEKFLKHKTIEYWEVENMPQKETEEIREIYRAKGFKGKLLEEVVSVIVEDKDRWVDVMMKEELDMIEDLRAPITIGGVTYIAFLVSRHDSIIGLFDRLFVSPRHRSFFMDHCVHWYRLCAYWLFKGRCQSNLPLSGHYRNALIGSLRCFCGLLCGLFFRGTPFLILNI